MSIPGVWVSGAKAGARLTGVRDRMDAGGGRWREGGREKETGIKRGTEF